METGVGKYMLWPRWERRRTKIKGLVLHTFCPNCVWMAACTPRTATAQTKNSTTRYESFFSRKLRRFELSWFFSHYFSKENGCILHGTRTSAHCTNPGDPTLPCPRSSFSLGVCVCYVRTSFRNQQPSFVTGKFHITFLLSFFSFFSTDAYTMLTNTKDNVSQPHNHTSSGSQQPSHFNFLPLLSRAFVVLRSHI